MIDAYAAESAVLRASAATGPDAALHVAVATVATHEAFGRIELAARAALAALVEGDTLRTSLSALRAPDEAHAREPGGAAARHRRHDGRQGRVSVRMRRGTAPAP